MKDSSSSASSVGDRGHREDVCPLHQGQDHGQDLGQGSPVKLAKQSPGRPQMPQADATYGSWMLVKKPARRRSNRQQNLAGTKVAIGPGEEQHNEPNGATANLEGRANLERDGMQTNQTWSKILAPDFEHLPK